MTNRKDGGAANDPIQMAIKALELSLPCVRAGSISLPDDDIKELYERHERSLTALRQHQQDGGWLPIESAPKDGRTVFVSHTPYNKASTAIAFYVGKFTQEDDSGEYDDGFMDEHENGTYYWPEGWYSYQSVDEEVYLKIKPTHWQPLPPAPKKENYDERS